MRREIASCSETQSISLKKVVGSGYVDFWRSTKRYIAVKGSRGSKKSCTAASRFIYLMMKYGDSGLYPNLLVIRRYYNTHRDSTRAQLVWAIERLGASADWKIPKGELTLTYIPTGQQILFRGMDDPNSLTSITVSKGNLCWVWFEEAFQINSEDDFNKVDMSIRGQLPPGLFHQIVLTFNPWSDRHWLKRRFFDSGDPDTLALTTTYRCNEFLSESDKALYEKMKVQNPRRYRIEGDGEWGIAEGLIYENWIESEFDIEKVIENAAGKKTARGLPALVPCNGMDFGYNDPTAFYGAYADRKDYKIYVYYEFYKTMMENRKIAARLITDGFGEAVIRADSEDPRTINELRLLGLRGIIGAGKGSGSVVGGIQKLQDYQIIVHPKCPKMIEALSNYAWKKDRLSGKVLNEPEHDFSHAPDALRYGCEDLQKFGIQV